MLEPSWRMANTCVHRWLLRVRLESAALKFRRGLLRAPVLLEVLGEMAQEGHLRPTLMSGLPSSSLARDRTTPLPSAPSRRRASSMHCHIEQDARRLCGCCQTDPTEKHNACWP